jgi:Bacterial capsule synthesis protein PGA_cap
MKHESGHLKCIFVGDLALGDHPKSVGFGFYSKYRKCIPLEKSVTLFKERHHHNILFGNLEFTIGNATLKGNTFDELNCRGIAKYAEFLERAGFNAVNVANNHIYQHGIEEFENTINILIEKGIGVVGLRRNESQSNVISIGDQTVCFLGWSARPRQGFPDIPPYLEFDEDSCFKDIVEAKQKFSYVFVSVHWGEEFIEIPSMKEKEIARKMIDLGVSVVIGHHPHVVREVEEYKGGLIAYSLGNFICDMTWSKKTRKTCYLYVEFADGAISKWEMIHGVIDDSYFPNFVENYCDESSHFNEVYKQLFNSSYEYLSLRALRHHQILTVIHILRNCWKYKPKVWLSMLLKAIKDRLHIRTSRVV